jgi:putative membrane protein insertion efficiency factor
MKSIAHYVPLAIRLQATVISILSKLLILLVHVYRHTIGLLLPAACRYTPTCSNYAIDAIKKYGPVQGSGKAASRILRCHPYSKHSSYDPV